MSLTLTARELITQAFQDNGIFGPTETPRAEQIAMGLQRLTQLIDSWNLQSLTVLVVNRVTYPLVANQQTYTIGPASLTPDFDTSPADAARPPRIEGAGLILNYTTPTVEVPLGMITDDQYQLIGIKAQTSTQPTQVYYNATDPLGAVFLWPKPTTAVNGLALYLQQLTPQMASLSTSYVLPPGYARALRLCLAVELCMPSFGVPLDPNLDRAASAALRNLKAGNVKPTDLGIDAALQPSVPGGAYNILSDQGA